jgi:hypothetical protein
LIIEKLVLEGSNIVRGVGFYKINSRKLSLRHCRCCHRQCKFNVSFLNGLRYSWNNSTTIFPIPIDILKPFLDKEKK